MADESTTDKAKQSVAQSTAIAVQDAADNLRNLNTISTTAIGVALSQLIATGDPKYVQVIQEAQKVMEKGTANFAELGGKAAEVAKKFG
ncbi:hypothetical protein [Marinomonas mediterranea]|jgi:hypothetical protein|uniref:Uncharacterized protein n=1 Tax=Marinomonas mediterranea (strain ATCC 700492 / JCM 21426 / NBRC 103028 / MMB-1) TaxID=717774 RepID=F2JXJ9_MARM1|nr:hypothetical protein [Marinomonas mediterranea]ADZ91899.1 hypothetical protein Marme_2668 [Marinomonas mediterranea MMB-1]WCN09850.1 hypothetical protein GV055_13455 [Marinomonas mediterranea]WCN13934.1 hypothetical protein GV054_13470 [Marinomonas mediterranea]WCN17986.1 hypothetical protein GV053_13495 [Marinomonas mediterranea MMB-1]